MEKHNSAFSKFYKTLENFGLFDEVSLQQSVDYTILKVIGEGANGKVCLAKKKSDGKLYAIKSINKSSLFTEKQIRRTISERRILETIKHPFIVQLKFAHNTPDKLYYVLDYCPGGELFFYLARMGKFNEN